MEPTTKGRIKLITVAISAIILGIVIFQNREPVKTDILFETIELPRAVLLLLAVLAGFVLGLLTSARMITVGRDKKEKTAKKEPPKQEAPAKSKPVHTPVKTETPTTEEKPANEPPKTGES